MQSVTVDLSQRKPRPTRICNLCGREHHGRTSQICHRCRGHLSKKTCSVEGCDEVIGRDSVTCLRHRRLQMGFKVEECAECHVRLLPTRSLVCEDCRKKTYAPCPCGCGRYKRKYTKRGIMNPYISGHNDAAPMGIHRVVKCSACGRDFETTNVFARLCSDACAERWFSENRLWRNKRVLVQCDICGTEIFRALYRKQHVIQSFACSKACRYKLVARKLSMQRKDSPKQRATVRDGHQCRICGFLTIVHVHHIIPKREDGPDALDNLITLCPNHHAMADRGMLSREDLRRHVESAETAVDAV